MFKPRTVEMLRAWLVAASIGAVCIDICVVIAAIVFDVPERIFETNDFRVAMAASLMLWLLAARSLAGTAFQSALTSRHVTLADDPAHAIAMRDDCPHRLLVLFHIRTHRKPLAPLPA